MDSLPVCCGQEIDDSVYRLIYFPNFICGKGIVDKQNWASSEVCLDSFSDTWWDGDLEWTQNGAAMPPRWKEPPEVVPASD